MTADEHTIERWGGGWAFVLRWAGAVTVAVVLASVIEYALAARQLERRVLQESVRDYVVQVEGLERALASGDDRRTAALEELRHIKNSYGTEYVGLFDARGRPVLDPDDDGDIPVEELQEVLETGEPAVEAEDDEGESSQGRYEFLLPVRTPEGLLVLEVDQSPQIVRDFLHDLRVRKALGVLLVVVLAVPLSYLLGGRRLHRRQREAERTADTDALTGVLSRRPFGPALDQALRATKGTPLSLAVLDIDSFKELNDRLGHSHGDRVLVALGRALGALRAGDTAYRMGGDEFAVLLPDTDDREAAEVLERVRRALSAAVPGVTLSVGVAAVTRADGVGRHELWERADAAVYEAKRLGRNRIVAYSVMSADASVSADKLQAVGALLTADAALTVAFQPIWNLQTGRILGHEALLRLPVGSPVDGPAEAFALAHRLGVAAELDERARGTVLAAVTERAWHGLLFLNVHPDALRLLDVDAFALEVQAAGLTPADVVLEVTEQADLDNPEHIRVLKRAHSRGFGLALDDLGQGNAGLRALTHVRFDVVKLDRAVIARLGTDPASDATVAAATTFVLQTGGLVIAEGIEDICMLGAVLRDTQRATGSPVLAGQGYLLGRPAAAPLDEGAAMPESPAVASVPAG